MNSPLKSGQPPIKEAVECWNSAEADRFEFCVLASQIVGRYEDGATLELAAKISRSPSTVHNYAKVGELWSAMKPQDAEHYRDAVAYSFWPPLAQLWKNDAIKMTGVIHWMDEKIEHKWTLEKFRSLLPSCEGRSIWRKSAKQWLKQTAQYMDEELINSPAFDIDPKEYKKVVRALKLARGRIEKAVT